MLKECVKKGKLNETVFWKEREGERVLERKKESSENRTKNVKHIRNGKCEKEEVKEMEKGKETGCWKERESENKQG